MQQAVPQEKPHRSAAEYVLRYLTLVVGLFIMSVGVALSFAFLHRLQGVREGTVAAAVFVGLIARGLNRFLVPLGNKFYAICRKTKKRLRALFCFQFFRLPPNSRNTYSRNRRNSRREVSRAAK